MEFSYETIKLLAKETGRKVTDLIALASQNDPFYQGTPGSRSLAEWFAEIYYRQNWQRTRVHIRRAHYTILSLGSTLPNGKPYENTEECWNTLLMASKAARYLKLVDVTSFDDRKNDDPVSYDDSSRNEAELRVDDYLYTSDLEVPRFPSLPFYTLDNFQASQRYHLEVWCEKTSMNDELIPLCQSYGMTLQTGAGELSITLTRLLAERMQQSGKPTRIFYISDFDPAGQSMPVAVARKLEYFVRTDHLDVDVRLFPVILTADQVRQYQLPRTPIKESERRRAGFEAHHGEGAVELDALEALRPGELQQILRGYIERYYDYDLDARTREARAELERDYNQISREVVDNYQDQIGDLRSLLEQIHVKVAPEMEQYAEGVRALWEEISDELKARAPDLDAYVIPEADEANEMGEGLYNSQRNYQEQLEAYKAFQGK
ncbi:MAG TPA: hypothetical protein VEL31_29570 [Ktedonobacteraceae bacterium]|nr:hypothetical protein [Ktedonobacteraceae bacterium]